MKNSRLMLAVTAMAVASAFGFAAHADVRNDGGPISATIEQMQNRILQITEEINNITATANADARDLTDDERTRFDSLFAEFERLEGDVTRYERNAQINTAVRAGAGRQTDPNANGGAPAPVATNPNASRAQAAAGGARASVPAQPKDNRDVGTWGFRSFADYTRAVVASSARGASPDPRLIQNAPTTWGSEGVGQDGGFAVPPDFRTQILQKVMSEESLVGRTDQLTTSGNSITFPTDSTTPWQTSGGIQAYWESEGGQKQQSKPELGETTIKANKIIALVPVTDELLEDAPAMAAYINGKAPEKINFRVNQALISGSGVGQPLGILNSPGTLTVDPVSGQAADSVVMQNIMDMYYAIPRGNRSRAVWLMNEDAEKQLPYMKFIDQGSGNAVPIYLPPGGLSTAQYGTLLGRPIVPSEAVPGLGDTGDIMFGDWSQYHTLMKTGGIRQDVSIHLFFDYDMTAFRFVMRVGGQPKWNAPIVRPNNGTPRAFFAALGARS